MTLSHSILARLLPWISSLFEDPRRSRAPSFPRPPRSIPSPAAVAMDDDCIAIQSLSTQYHLLGSLGPQFRISTSPLAIRANQHHPLLPVTPRTLSLSAYCGKALVQVLRAEYSVCTYSLRTVYEMGNIQPPRLLLPPLTGSPPWLSGVRLCALALPVRQVT